MEPSNKSKIKPGQVWIRKKDIDNNGVEKIEIKHRAHISGTPIKFFYIKKYLSNGPEISIISFNANLNNEYVLDVAETLEQFNIIKEKENVL